MLSFDNTEVAFSGKSDSDLTRSYWLFKLIENSTLVSWGQKLTTFAIKFHLPIKSIIKATIFRQFVGGENIHECTATIVHLAKHKIGTILDYSVEGKEKEADFDTCALEIIATIDEASENKNIPFCVFKTTGLSRNSLLEKVSSKTILTVSEKTEYENVRKRVDKICGYAHLKAIPIFIDAEETWMQGAVDALVIEMMEKYNKEKVIVYNTYQLYRVDRLDCLKKDFTNAEQGNYMLGAKLVRGAYMEKERDRALEMNYPSPIHTSKEATDKDYNTALEFCVAHLDRLSVCAGTHNEMSSLHLCELMKTKNIDLNNKHICFSQLLGMSDHISFNLANVGYNVAKYVPYGPVNDVLPYLIRRAQENTSVKGQTGRELSLIIKEQKRRKLIP